MPALDEFLGSAVGGAAGFAAGHAVGPVLAPILRRLESDTWEAYPDQPLAVMALAQAVAEGKTLSVDIKKEPGYTGFNQARFDSLVTVFQSAPAIAAAMELQRRGLLKPGQFATLLKRARLEPDWIAAYTAVDANGLMVWEHPLSPADIALGLIRNNLAPQDVGGQPMFPPGGSSAGSIVPHDPVSEIDVLKEAALSGMDPERMAILARNVGLPPGVIEGLRMLNRGIIDEPSFYLLIEQSDARLSWGPYLIQLRWNILTAHEAAESYLRGWITLDDAHARGLAAGYKTADMDRLIEMIGRPLAVKQITTGLARGGTFGGIYEGVPEPYLSAIRESNIRPEYGNLAYANRFTLPGAFVIRALLKDGAITADQGHTLLLESGWPEQWARLVADHYAAAGGTATDPHVRSAVTAAYTQLRKLFVNGTYTEAQTAAFQTDLADAQKAPNPLLAVYGVLRTIENPPTAPAGTPTGI
jgi:hypothetical protein